MYVISCLLAIALSFPFFSAKNPKTVTQLAVEAERSIVRITYTRYNDEGVPQTQVCTGFVVSASRGIALTARHCVSDEFENLADDLPTEILKESDHLALISVPKMARPPLDIRDGETNIGEPIVSVGFGFGSLKVLVRSVAGFEEGYLVTDGSLLPGMSGGPVLDVYGRVVGVNQATNEYVGLACTAEELRAFLKEK